MGTLQRSLDDYVKVGGEIGSNESVSVFVGCCHFVCRGHGCRHDSCNNTAAEAQPTAATPRFHRACLYCSPHCTQGELMEGDNAYMCEELGKRVPAVKRTAIKSLPQMLCVHLKRFEFDYLNQTRHKLRDRCGCWCGGAVL